MTGGDGDVLESPEEQAELSRLMRNWKRDPQSVKAAFDRLREKLSKKEDTVFTFKARAGVSYSLRVWIGDANGQAARLLALVDVIDDDPESRWLSICFYEGMITDPEGLGNLVPKGILGEDGLCFDLFEYDEAFISYVEKRIDEAYGSASSR